MPKGVPAGLAALLLGFLLLVTGFVVGYGYRSPASSQPALTSEVGEINPPNIKGLHASPNGKLLAFTTVYNRAQKSAVFLLNVESGLWSKAESPQGWQDYVTQWSRDGSSLLLEREKIPQPVAEARSGMYGTKVNGAARPIVGDLEPITQGIGLGTRRLVSGFLAPDGGLILKTRTEPKTLYRVEGQELVELDHAEVTYGQNRAVTEFGQEVLYVVRDIAGSPDKEGLFRVVQGKATLISPTWENVIWSYVSDSGEKVIVARQAANGEDWSWDLFRITPTKTVLLKTAVLPSDIITVYWSPDEKIILGAAGDKLWKVSLPDLTATQLGSRTDWHAEDVSWLGGQKTVVVAVAGELWQLDMATGTHTRLWRMPDEYWK